MTRVSMMKTWPLVAVVAAALVALNSSTLPAAAAGWTRDVGALLAAGADRHDASEYAACYVDFLRKNGGASPDCRVRAAAK